MNKDVKEVSEEDPGVRCDFCRQSTVNQFELGKLYQYEGVTVHYFCLLFASGLNQNGKDEEGIEGFLTADIRKEVRRGAPLKCKFCKKGGATIGCALKICRSSYHFPCGLKNNCNFQFTESFTSYCAQHKAKVKIPLPKSEWLCPICFGEVDEEDRPLWPPCCKKRVFHTLCIVKMGYNHGIHFFKCPVCNDKDKFKLAMKKSGVFLPDRDATWETGNTFADHGRVYSRCDARECLCPHGRDHSAEKDSDPWTVVRCGTCGASGVHKQCGNCKNLKYRCPTCELIFTENRTTRTRVMPRYGYEGSDDEAPDDSVVSVKNVLEPVLNNANGYPQHLRKPAMSSDTDKVELYTKRTTFTWKDIGTTEPAASSISRRGAMAYKTKFRDALDHVILRTNDASIPVPPSLPILSKDSLVKGEPKMKLPPLKQMLPEILSEKEITSSFKIFPEKN